MRNKKYLVPILILLAFFILGLHIFPWSPAVRVELYDFLNDPLGYL